MVEYFAVNEGVVGSNPTPGACELKTPKRAFLICIIFRCDRKSFVWYTYVMQRFAVIGVLAILVIVAGGVLWYGSASVPPETGMRITLYFYNPALDQGPGGVQCSRNGLVAVERIIPETTMPLTEAIKLLLRGEIAQEERAKGIGSEFPLEGVALTSATVENGVATLTFADPQNKTGGGSCRVGILWAQIEASTQQFPTVQSVRFMPEELFQP